MIHQTFGWLTVTAFIGSNKHQKKVWRCRCKCGTEMQATTGDLRSGHVKSCGCYEKEHPGRLSHGHHRAGKQSQVYTAWINLRQRCANTNHPQYHDYGGRGITYDPRWESFEAFVADMGEPPTGLTLDRINNDGNYEPSNCRWATRREQRLNRRDVRMVTHKGETMTVTEWADKLGINPVTLITRLNRGWPLERALTSGVYHRSGNFRPNRIA